MTGVNSPDELESIVEEEVRLASCRLTESSLGHRGQDWHAREGLFEGESEREMRESREFPRRLAFALLHQSPVKDEQSRRASEADADVQPSDAADGMRQQQQQ